MTAYEIDKDNPDMVLCWGVVREEPWHLDSVYPTRAAAETRQAQLGADYIVKFGSRRLASDDFIWHE